MFKAFLRVGFYFFIMCPGISSAVEVIKIKPDEQLVLGSSERTNKIRTIENTNNWLNLTGLARGGWAPNCSYSRKPVLILRTFE